MEPGSRLKIAEWRAGRLEEDRIVYDRYTGERIAFVMYYKGEGFRCNLVKNDGLVPYNFYPTLHQAQERVRELVEGLGYRFLTEAERNLL